MSCSQRLVIVGLLASVGTLAGCSTRVARVQPARTPSAAGETTKTAPEQASAEPIAAPQPAEAPAPWPPLPADSMPHFLTNASQHTYATVGRNFDPDLDPQGQWLVFASTRNSLRPDIFLKRVDGYALTQLTHDPADDVQPRFSPDGRRIVFASNRGGNWDLWMINLDGTGLVRLTDDAVNEIAPAWSPDGKQIAFTVWGRRSGQWEIWTIDVARPSVRKFLTYGMFPDWSADGKRLVFQRARQRGTRHFSVWTVELIDGEARNPTEIAYSDTWACITPRWSPDGRSVVYASVPATTRPAAPVAAVWALDLQTGLKTKLTNGNLTAFNPIWAPDGRVYFVAASQKSENIWSVQPASASATHARRGSDAMESASSLPKVNAPVTIRPEARP